MPEQDPRWEEYKILQDKIDKIGAFCFQVRGWSVTLVTAALVSGYSLDRIPAAAMLSGLLLVFIFQCLEQNQRINQSVLIARVRQLERGWLRGPRTGREIVRSMTRARRTGRSPVSMLRWFFFGQVHTSFYVLTYLFVLVVFMFRIQYPPSSTKQQIAIDPVAVRMIPASQVLPNSPSDSSARRSSVRNTNVDTTHHRAKP